MMMRQTMIYTQIRLQARHGLRPDEHLWQWVEAKKELAGFLQAARQSPLKMWVAGMQATDQHHVIESALLASYRGYVAEVARWVPAQWGDAVGWVVCLTYLPVLQHLLSGNTAQRWMRDDPALKDLTVAATAQRLESFAQSPFAPMLDAWQSGQSLRSCWLAHWQSLWPSLAPRQQGPLLGLVRLLQVHIEIFSQLPPAMSVTQRRQLAGKLTMIFRRSAFHPVSVFAHLLLVALDLERLRGAILQRRLFPFYKEEIA